MARKKYEEMSFDELKSTREWYEKQVRFIKFLMQDKFGGHS